MARLEIGGENGHWTPEEVGVFGRLFVTRRVSRSVNKKITDINERLSAAANDDEAFELVAEMMDALLAPTGGQKKTAGQVLREKWEADELFLDQIEEFSRQVQESAVQGPPTPAAS